MSTITPTIDENGNVYYCKNGMNIQRVFGVHPVEFLQMHENLVEKGLRVITTNQKAQIDFVLYCNGLITNGADIGILIREYNKAQKGDGTEVAHALSLAKLYYHYHIAGHSVCVQQTHKSDTSPDIVVDDVECELKVRIDQGRNRMKPYMQKLLEGGITEKEYANNEFSDIRSMKEDLDSASSRVEEGFCQADCVFLDLSSHFHSWNYHRLKALEEKDLIQGLSNKPISPISNACILFSPDNAMDLGVVGFMPKAHWGYLLLDGE